MLSSSWVQIARKSKGNLRLLSSTVLDAAFLSENSDAAKDIYVNRRGLPQLADSIDRIKVLRHQRSSLILREDAGRAQRNKLSSDIGAKMKQGLKEDAATLKLLSEKAAEDIAEASKLRQDTELELNSLLSYFPNLLDESVPRGQSEDDNVVISSWGECKVGENYRWHDDIARALNGFDTESAARMSGSRFSVLLGSVAKLERALVQYFLDFHSANGYLEVSPPYIVGRSALEGTGQLPKFEEDLFKVNHQVGGEDAYLIPTAEVSLTNLFREQILLLDDLPIRMASHTPCFRAEAGSAGRDSKGLLRQHQFHKVELVAVCTAETSAAEHERMTGHVEQLLQSLDLPHRRVLLCDRDTGFSARKCFDLEVWLPGQQKYREISSISNCGDFQSRRMNLRYRHATHKVQGKKNEHPHTLNGSGVAVGRALAAVLETYQQPDGSVSVPEVLRPYLKGATKLEASKNVLKFY